jgi:hypothetical protein
MGATGRRVAERRGPKPRHKVALTAAEFRELQRLTRRRTAPYAEVVRAKILLLAYEHPDWSNAAIARTVGCTDRTVHKWRRRNRAGPALQDGPPVRWTTLFPPQRCERRSPRWPARCHGIPVSRSRAGRPPNCPRGRPARHRPAYLRRHHPALAQSRPHQAVAIPQLATPHRPALPRTGHPHSDPVRTRPAARPEGAPHRLRG